MSFFSRLLGFFSKDEEPISEPLPIGVGAASEVPDEMVRARDGKGRYIADDPGTEQDEAWVKRESNERKTD